MSDPIYDLNKAVPKASTDFKFRAPTTGTTGVRDDLEVIQGTQMGTTKPAPTEAPWRSGDHDGIITA